MYDLLVVDLANSDAGTMDRLSRVRHDARHKDVPIFVITDSGFDSSPASSDRPRRVRRDPAAIPGTRTPSRASRHISVVGRELNRARAEARSRSELVTILKEITASLNSTEIYQILVRRVASGLRIARCSVVLAAPGGREGTVVAAYENPNLRDLRVDLEKYPEITRALTTGETVMVSDVDADPLYQGSSS